MPSGSAGRGAGGARPPARNPGPSWGFQFMCACDRILPEWIFRPVRMAGTWVALLNMPTQRRHSRAYLSAVLRRPPTWLDLFRHFFAFEEALMLKLRVANGRPHRGVHAADSVGFRQLLATGEHALLGTFHIGDSDIVGYLLGGQEHRRVFMIRHRVGNSHDTDRLGQLFGKWVTFIWVNDGENLLFALKDAAAADGSLAMKCDRLEFSAKSEAFEFLGARRLFPFTIYHLSIIFRRPVILSVGVPGAPGESVVHSAPQWDPDPALRREENLARARVHFQGFLRKVEALLQANPYLWFNFIELNPPVSDVPVTRPADPACG